MKYVIHIPTLEAWLERTNRRAVDLVSLSGLGVGTVYRALNGEPISKGTLSALSLGTGLTESDLLGKENESPLQRSDKKTGGAKNGNSENRRAAGKMAQTKC